jgi:hypothetical protein
VTVRFNGTVTVDTNLADYVGKPTLDGRGDAR